MSLLKIAADFDAESKARIRRMHRFEHYIQVEMGRALFEAAEIVAMDAKLNTWNVFAHPTGQLEDTIEAVSLGPWEAAVDVTAPYAARREFGFSGHTDALGRHYVNDPALPYAYPALWDNQERIELYMWGALNLAILDLTLGSEFANVGADF
jgi:hypothetical protein